jgi:hypothetical protein
MNDELKNFFEFYLSFKDCINNEDEIGSIFGLSTIEGIFFPKRQVKIKTNHRSEKKFKPIIQIYNALSDGLYFIEQNESYELINKLEIKDKKIFESKKYYKNDFQKELIYLLKRREENFEDAIRNVGIELTERIKSQQHSRTQNRLSQDYDILNYLFARKNRGKK